MEFNHKQLPDVFDNVEHLRDYNDHECVEFHFSDYSVKGDNGEEVGTFAFLMGEIHIDIPGEYHKSYVSNLPIETFEQLKSDLARAGLILINGSAVR